jgi:TRAP-type C4-dicarboxylate transport system substrate-binding protein
MTPSPTRLRFAVMSLVIATALPATADPVQLKLASFGPTTSFFLKEVIDPWIAKVNRDAEGTLLIRHFGGGVIADQRQMYDAVRSNVAQIGWVTPSNVPGKFKRTAVFELPLGVRNGEQGAVVYWRLYEQGLFAGEYNEMAMLGAMVFPPGGIMTRNRKVATLEDLVGVKLRVTGPLQNDVIRALGASTVATSIDQLYQSLDKGVLDGYASAFTAIRPFRLYEVTKYYTQVSLNSSTSAVLMNRQVYEQLPDAAKAAISRNSGEPFSRALGQASDREVARVLADIRHLAAQGKGELIRLAPSEEERWRERTDPVVQEWARSTPDGQKVMDAFRRELLSVDGQ